MVRVGSRIFGRSASGLSSRTRSMAILSIVVSLSLMTAAITSVTAPLSAPGQICIGAVSIATLGRSPRLAAIAAAPDGTVVIHCLSGVDRTGMLAAIVLDAMGVDRLANQARGIEAYAVCAHPALVSEAGPETIIELLKHIDDVHGGVHAYLRANGIRDDHMMMLRGRLLLMALAIQGKRG